jgi:hypothetical protein
MASTISAGTTAGTALNMTGDTTGNLAFQTGAGTNTITVPNGTGTIAVQGVSTNIVSGTAVTASGTSVEFTGIPTWVKRITLTFSAVSTNGTSTPYLIQIGPSSGVETTGYLGSSSYITSVTPATALNTTAFALNVDNSATNNINGSMTISLINSSTNTWAASGVFGAADRAFILFVGYSKPLAGVLSRLKISANNGTDAFDNGTINILYE